MKRKMETYYFENFYCELGEAMILLLPNFFSIIFCKYKTNRFFDVNELLFSVTFNEKIFNFETNKVYTQKIEKF